MNGVITTVNMAKDLSEFIREQSFQQRKPKYEIVNEAIAAYKKKLEHDS